MSEIISDVINWHYERNLIEGATDESQSVKLLEEYIELVAALYPVNHHRVANRVISDTIELLEGGRIKSVAVEDSREAKKDALGDMLVVMINIAERNGWDIEECLESAYSEIKDRKGRMIDGKYIKQEDLPKPEYDKGVWTKVNKNSSIAGYDGDSQKQGDLL